jgi:hypothetical protein
VLWVKRLFSDTSERCHPVVECRFDASAGTGSDHDVLGRRH